MSAPTEHTAPAERGDVGPTSADARYWRDKAKHLAALCGMAHAKLLEPVSDRDIRTAREATEPGVYVMREVIEDEKRDAARDAAAARDAGSAGGEDERPITQRERELIQQRCDNHDAGLSVGLTDRAVFALRGYEAALSAALASPAPADENGRALDFPAMEKRLRLLSLESPSATCIRALREVLDGSEDGRVALMPDRDYRALFWAAASAARSCSLGTPPIADDWGWSSGEAPGAPQPASPAPEAPGEPVAWRVRLAGHDEWTYRASKPEALARNPEVEVEPLYRAPVPEQTAETPSEERTRLHPSEIADGDLAAVLRYADDEMDTVQRIIDPIIRDKLRGPKVVEAKVTDLLTVTCIASSLQQFIRQMLESGAPAGDTPSACHDPLCRTCRDDRAEAHEEAVTDAALAAIPADRVATPTRHDPLCRTCIADRAEAHEEALTDAALAADRVAEGER